MSLRNTINRAVSAQGLAVARCTGFRAQFILATTVLFVIACSGDGPTPSLLPSPKTIVLSAPVTRIEIGQPLTIAAVVRDTRDSVMTNVVVQWTISPVGIASVVGGVVTAIAPGTATITAASGAASAKINIDVVSAAVASVKLTAPQLTLAPQQQTTVMAEVRDARQAIMTGRTVAWNTSDSRIATIDNSGRVTAIALGAVFVSGIVEGVRDSLAISVTAGASTLVILPSDVSVVIGGHLPLVARVRDANGALSAATAVTWQSDNASFATVSNAGVITAAGVGSTVVRATSGALTASVPVQVKAAGVTSVFAVAPNATSNQGGEIRADSVNIAGLLETSGPLKIVSAGDVIISGRILNACAPITIIAAGRIEISGSVAVAIPASYGTIDNRCSTDVQPDQLPKIHIEGASYSVSRVALRPAGDFVITNAPGMLLPDVSGAPIDRDRVACVFDGVTIFSATESPAGRDGQIGEKGRDGGRIEIGCRGSFQSFGDSHVRTRAGGNGGTGTHTVAGAAHAIGGDGGRSGSIRFWVTGDVLSNGIRFRFYANSPGNGGDATATTTSSESAAAVALGGRGGDVGAPDVPPIDMRVAGSFVLGTGGGTYQLTVMEAGAGGAATAVGGNGRNATSAALPFSGGAATAIGGDGGRANKSNMNFEQMPTIGFIVFGSNSGTGGDARATAGNGGAGSSEFPNGAPGGTAQAVGGTSRGTQMVTIGNNAPVPEHGGSATFFGGHGGAGFSRCSPAGIGGVGGAGGALIGSGGRGGQSQTAVGAPGAVVVFSAGNGGAGGNGATPGVGGNKGQDQIVALGAKTLEPPSLTNGATGLACTP